MHVALGALISVTDDHEQSTLPLVMPSLITNGAGM